MRVGRAGIAAQMASFVMMGLLLVPGAAAREADDVLPVGDAAFVEVRYRGGHFTRAGLSEGSREIIDYLGGAIANWGGEVQLSIRGDQDGYLYSWIAVSGSRCELFVQELLRGYRDLAASWPSTKREFYAQFEVTPSRDPGLGMQVEIGYRKPLVGKHLIVNRKATLVSGHNWSLPQLLSMRSLAQEGSGPVVDALKTEYADSPGLWQLVDEFGVRSISFRFAGGGRWKGYKVPEGGLGFDFRY